MQRTEEHQAAKRAENQQRAAEGLQRVMAAKALKAQQHQAVIRVSLLLRLRLSRYVMSLPRSSVKWRLIWLEELRGTAKLPSCTRSGWIGSHYGMRGEFRL